MAISPSWQEKLNKIKERQEFYKSQQKPQSSDIVKPELIKPTTLPTFTSDIKETPITQDVTKPSTIPAIIPSIRPAAIPEKQYMDRPELDTTKPSVGEYISATPIVGDLYEGLSRSIEQSKSLGRPVLDEDLAMELMSYYTLEKSMKGAGQALGKLYRVYGDKISPTARRSLDRVVRDLNKIDISVDKIVGPANKAIRKLFPKSKPEFVTLPEKAPTAEEVTNVVDLTTGDIQRRTKNDIINEFKERIREKVAVEKTLSKQMTQPSKTPKLLESKLPGEVVEQKSPLDTTVVLPTSKKVIALPPQGVEKVTKEGVELRKDVIEQLKSKDIASVESGLLDMERFGVRMDNGATGLVHDEIVIPQRQIAIDSALYENKLLSAMEDVMYKQLGLKKSDDTLLRRFAEKKMSSEEIKALGVDKVHKYNQARKWFERTHENLRVETNKVLKQLGKPTIPKRSDYIHHAQEWSALSKIFGGDVSAIPNKVLNDFVKPTSKKLGAALKRTGGIPEDQLKGAFSSFGDYVSSVSKTIHASKQISKLRGYANAEGMPAGVAKYLNTKADDLIGIKKDWTPTTPFEVGIMRLASATHSRWANNMILGNLSTIVSQTAQAVTNSAYTGIFSALKDIPKGTVQEGARTISGAVGQTLNSVRKTFGKNILDGSQNPYFEHFASKYSQVFKAREAVHVEEIRKATGIIERVAQDALGFFDRSMTSAVFNTIYSRSVKSMGHETAAKFADSIASRSAAEFDKNMKPHILNLFFSKFYAPISTVAINNANLIRTEILPKVISPMVRKKIDKEGLANSYEGLSMLAKMYATGVLTNIGFRFASGDDRVSVIDFVLFSAGARMGFGGSVRYVQKLMQEGTNKKALTEDAVFSLAFPWGGQQLKKTISGIKAATQGGVYSNDYIFMPSDKEKKKRLLFKIQGLDIPRSILFGPSSTKAAREYYNKKKK